MPRKSSSETEPLVIQQIGTNSIDLFIVGRTPLVLHRMSEKAKRELLLPKGKKTRAEKAAQLKHDIMAEFRDSPERLPDPDAPTLLAIPAAAIKRAIASAALVVPGARKSEIARVTWIEGRMLPVYGIPHLYIDTVRMSDMARTPDIRTRVAVPRWAVPVRVVYVSHMLTEATVINLLDAAGLTIGIGDGRQEKGALNYGQFRVASDSDPELSEILTMGRSLQEEAMENPPFFDAQSRELYEWYSEEVVRRGLKTA